MSQLRKCSIEDCWHTATGKSKYCQYHKKVARDKWLQMIADKQQNPGESRPKAVKAKPNTSPDKAAKFERIWQLCCESAERAAKACKPTPMFVQQHANVMNDRSPVKQQWIVESGICGMAVVRLPLNHPFTQHLIKRGYARKNTYESGASVKRMVKSTESPLEQSYERNCAMADAFVNTLIKHLPTLRNRVNVWRHID